MSRSVLGSVCLMLAVGACRAAAVEVPRPLRCWHVETQEQRVWIGEVVARTEERAVRMAWDSLRRTSPESYYDTTGTGEACP
jgi:hypothetical protein